jgi:putative cell wall-binding protein
MRKARKSLAILLAVAMVFCMAPAMVFGAGDDGQVNRIAGNDRYITSAETALRAFESADTVLIARGDDEGGFADGLAASYLAGVENAPILLTEPNGLPPVVKDAISKLGAKKAIILGGPAVVSDKVKDDLAGLEVERIFGDDRFETAAKIAAKGKADTAFVVSGYAPADSLVAGPLAFSKNYPILLVGNNVPDFTSKALADLGIKNIYVIGGTGVVSESVYNDLAAKADQIVRYGGNDRVATSLEVAQNLYTNPVNFSIVGYDGLADAVGAAVFGNPILYTDSDLGISGIQSYLAGAVTADSNVNIFGGTGVVSNAAETALENIVPDELKVEIVSAINDIEVEFGGEVVLPEMATIVLSDESEVEVPVTWEGEYDVNIAGTYELVGTLDLSALENVAATELTASVNVVVAEYVDTEAPVITLNGEAEVNLEFGAEYVEEGATAVDNIDGELEVTIEGTVDTSVAGTYTITYTATDAAGNVATATRIVVVAEEVRIPSTLTTEAEATINAVVGNKISIVYTVQDENEKPVIGTDVRVRATAGFPVTVVEEQVLTTDENGQVTFAYTSVDGRQDAIQAVVLEKPTLRNTAVTVEWVETAATVSVESPAAEGFIVSGATNVADELKTIKYVATFKDENGQPLADDEVVSVKLNIEDLTATSATAALNPVGTSNNEFAVAGSIYTATLDNGDGTAVLEFTVDQPAKVTPLFFVDANDDGSVDNDEPRAEGATVEVVDGTTQEPTFTLEFKEVDKDKGVNTDVTEVDSEYNVVDTKGIIFVLTAKDQYGNPFIGTANLNHKVHLDDLAGNDKLPGNIQFAYAEEDGTFTTDNNVTFSPTVDANGNGVIEIQAKQSSTSVGDTTNLVVWVDVNNNNKYDAGEGVESAKITFVEAEAAVLTSMKATADKTTVIADGTNLVTYTVELLDQDGKALDVSSNTVDVIIELYQDGVKLDQTNDTEAAIAATAGIGSAGIGTNNTEDFVATVNANDGKFTFTVTPAVAGSEFYPVVYVDVNEDEFIQADETMTVQGAAFEATALPNSYEIKLSATEVIAGETVDVTITALNSDATPATEVNFNGEQIVKVEILASDSSVLKTYNRTANFVDGVATVTVPVELVGSNKIKITMPLGTTDNATSVETLTVEAAEVSGLAVEAVTNNLFVADEFGNKVDYDFEGLATVTTDGTFSGSGSLDAENTMVLSIVDGDVKEGSTALTFTGAGKTLTIELSNGDTFSITL